VVDLLSSETLHEPVRRLLHSVLRCQGPAYELGSAGSAPSDSGPKRCCAFVQHPSASDDASPATSSLFPSFVQPCEALSPPSPPTTVTPTTTTLPMLSHRLVATLRRRILCALKSDAKSPDSCHAPWILLPWNAHSARLLLGITRLCLELPVSILLSTDLPPFDDASSSDFGDARRAAPSLLTCLLVLCADWFDSGTRMSITLMRRRQMALLPFLHVIFRLLSSRIPTEVFPPDWVRDLAAFVFLLSTPAKGETGACYCHKWSEVIQLSLNSVLALLSSFSLSLHRPLAQSAPDGPAPPRVGPMALCRAAELIIQGASALASSSSPAQPLPSSASTGLTPAEQNLIVALLCDLLRLLPLALHGLSQCAWAGDEKCCADTESTLMRCVEKIRFDPFSDAISFSICIGPR